MNIKRIPTLNSYVVQEICYRGLLVIFTTNSQQIEQVGVSATVTTLYVEAVNKSETDVGLQTRFKRVKSLVLHHWNQCRLIRRILGRGLL